MKIEQFMSYFLTQLVFYQFMSHEPYLHTELN